MVSIKEAARSAIEFAIDSLGPDRATGVRLEEVDSGLIKDRDNWFLTLSMLSSKNSDSLGALASVLNSSQKRDYKIFSVDKETGQVTSMKMRDFVTQ